MRRPFAPLGLVLLGLGLVHCSSSSGPSNDSAAQAVSVPAKFKLGGTVSGLAGSGLVLHSSLGDDLAVTASGPFAFSTSAPAGSSYTVTVKSQPASPSQSCTAEGASGTVGNADVTSIAVTCTTNAYEVGGQVTGLAGSGLVLRSTVGAVSTTLPVASSGAFQFPTAVPSGSAYAITVDAQPTDPSQTCIVSGGTGTVVGGDIGSVTVNCATDTFAVGGTVSGLAGTGLVLQNGGSDDLAVNANGSFAFATPVASGGSFAVTVKTQPTSPWQTCTVSGGSGSVVSGAVGSVVVACTTRSFALGGTVTGLAGTGLVLLSGSETLAVGANGAFAFPNALPSGSAYAVAVQQQPSGPAQTCTVTGGSGTILGAAVGDVAVACTTRSFTVGGTVSGLAGSGLVLQLDGAADLPVSASGTFTFATPVASGASYAVAVKTQPSGPTQECVVTGGTGQVGASAVTSVSVNCSTSSFAVGGTVAGLLGTGLALVQGADRVDVSGDGSFAFPTPVPSGAAYTVAVDAQPANPWQVCTVSGGTGQVGAGPVSVAVTCTTSSFAVRAAVAGLAGSGLVLQDNGGDDLPVAADGTFDFPTAVVSGASYAVTVLAQPTSPWQTCVVGGGSGTVQGGDVLTDVACTTNAYGIGGTVSGLLGALVLQDNGGDDLPLSADGAFAFAAQVASGATYAVTAASQPPTQTCTLAGDAGTVAGADVTDVAVTCACKPDLANCDGNAVNGCETNLMTSPQHCGACGTVCPVPAHAVSSCTGGACGWSCASGFGDCDHSATNGCEVNFANSDANCGACGNVCGGGTSCRGGVCK